MFFKISIVVLLVLICLLLIVGLFLDNWDDLTRPPKPGKSSGPTRVNPEKIPYSWDDLKPGPFNKL